MKRNVRIVRLAVLWCGHCPLFPSPAHHVLLLVEKGVLTYVKGLL